MSILTNNLFSWVWKNKRKANPKRIHKRTKKRAGFGNKSLKLKASPTIEENVNEIMIA